jgi:membrane-anchored protein YejM (alkaline phosphatase superfamily)
MKTQLMYKSYEIQFMFISYSIIYVCKLFYTTCQRCPIKVLIKKTRANKLCSVKYYIIKVVIYKLW